MDKCTKVAGLFIATLRAIALIHQNNHWVTSGEMFYSEHLLFERLYKSALEDLDLAAEKFIGLFGDDVLEYEMQNAMLKTVMDKYRHIYGETIKMSIAVESDFVKFCSDAYKCFEENGKLSLGLDDMIMSISSNREGSLYLLKQSMGE